MTTEVNSTEARESFSRPDHYIVIIHEKWLAFGFDNNNHFFVYVFASLTAQIFVWNIGFVYGAQSANKL